MEAAEIHRIPQSKYVDAVRWVSSPVSALDKLVAMAVYDFDSDESSIQIHSLLLNNKGAILNMVSSWCCPSRVSCLKRCDKNHKPLIAASTFEGSLHFLPLPLDSDLSLPPAGPISAIDFLCDSTPQCVTVGEDGRVNLVTLGDDSRLHPRRLFDSHGLVSYTALKSASPTEFATGGFGFTLHWWDHRKPGGLASASAWAPKSGFVHSIDIHESRKHVCVVGGSLGTVFAWDLRWQKQPILLSGIGSDEIAAHSPSASEVLPVIFCSEDGLLAVVKHGEEPMEIVVEPCAINSLDINPQNPSDVICSLEWETVALILRQ